MIWLRHPVVRSGCAGLAMLTTISLNLTPVMASAQKRSTTARDRVRQMGRSINQAASAAIPINPIPVADSPVHAASGKAVEKAAVPTAAATPAQNPQSPATEATDSNLATSADAEVSTGVPLTIRVKVGQTEQNAIQFAASTDAVLSAGNQTFQIASSTLYTAVASSQEIQVGDLNVSALEVDPGEDGYVFVNNRWYYGKLHIVFSGEGLISINELPLEAYLYSVVGAEMPTNWNTEALKAQAVAARSYAVAHLERPFSDWYNLGDDEHYQAYKGAESMDENSIAAVHATLGQVLSRDGRIHEAQYASTEEISREAHGGVGMSQYGAQAMAQSGNSYLQILGRYYSGTAIAVLQ